MAKKKQSKDPLTIFLNYMSGIREEEEQPIRRYYQPKPNTARDYIKEKFNPYKFIY